MKAGTQQQHDEDLYEKDKGPAPQVRQQSTPAGMKRLRLTRAIVLNGEHEDVGSIHDVSRPLAARLIGEGSAVHHLEEGESLEPGALTVNRMETPENRDPQSIRISRPAPKVKAPAEKK